MKYEILDIKCDENLLVSNVRGGNIDDDGSLRLTWTWPKDGNYNYCVVFELEKEMALEEIIHNGICGTPVENQFGLQYKTQLIGRRGMFKIYPARKVKKANGDQVYELINQASQNKSEMYYKQVRLCYSVEYSSSFFSKRKVANVTIEGISHLNEKYIMYRIVDGNRGDFKYPIDLDNKNDRVQFSIFIDKSESITLTLTEEQSRYINLIENKR